MGLKQRVSTAVARWALVLDKNTVLYGHGRKILDESTGYGWMCGRCLESSWCIATLPETKADAEEHARGHRGVSAVHEKG